MDSSPPPNPQENYPSFNHWLGFSLNPNPDISLFHHQLPFFPTPGINFSHQHDATSITPTTTTTTMGGAASDHDLATRVTNSTGGPKLEDFLGGSGIYPGGPSQDAAPTATAFYGTELQRVEALQGGFLHGFTAEDCRDIHKQQALVVSSSVASGPPPAPKKSAETFGHRTSIYRGVTRHRWTGRYEAHLWDNTCKREGQSRKGRQVYLGGYDKEEKAARAYDLAALKYWGPTTTTNFPVSDYEKELEEMKHMTRQEFVASLRRKSSGFSRGASIYRGVTRHHQHGRWQARIGRVAGNKDLYLGTFSTQEEAAEAYDIAAIKFRGANAVTNFDISRYDVKSIASSNLPVGGLSNKSSSSSRPTASCSFSLDDKNVASGTIPFHVSNLPDFPSPSSSTLSFTAVPTEQTTASYSCWPNQAIQIKNEQDPRRTTPTSAVTTDPMFNMEVSPSSLGYFGDGSGSGFAEQQIDTGTATCTTEGSCNDVPFATPVSYIGVGGGSGGNGGGSRTCVGPELHSFRAAKANLSALHTLIFGME